jgi:hypothetical protein
MTNNAAQAAELVRWRGRKTPSSRSATSSGSTPFWPTWKKSPPIPASSKPTAFLPTPPQHRHRRGAGFDDSRFGRRPGFCPFAGRQRGCRRDSRAEPIEDIANARLRFANGCVANLTASRVSPERMRKIRVFSGGECTSYVSLDYRAQEGFIYRVAREGEEESSLLKKLLRGKDSAIVSEFAGRKIVREPVPIEKDEPLKLELRDFIECVQSHKRPKSAGPWPSARWTWPSRSRARFRPDGGPLAPYGRLASHPAAPRPSTSGSPARPAAGNWPDGGRKRTGASPPPPPPPACCWRSGCAFLVEYGGGDRCASGLPHSRGRSFILTEKRGRARRRPRRCPAFWARRPIF